MHRGEIRATAEHAAYCFDALLHHLHDTDGREKDKVVAKERMEEREVKMKGVSCPLFVTWNKKLGIGVEEKDSSGYTLRGCIGTFEPKPLDRGLREYAVISAVRDSRFLPVKLSEVTALQCSTSLLHSFQAADSWDDWEVGQHGTTIDFKNPYSGRHHSATFLPEVAHSQQWDKKETLTHLINKAGCRVTDPDDLRMILDSVEVERYQSSKYVLEYSEYVTLNAELKPLGLSSSDVMEITVPA